MVCTGFSRISGVVLERFAARDKNGIVSGAEGSRKPMAKRPTPARLAPSKKKWNRLSAPRES
jgi:hypothetical protein